MNCFDIGNFAEVTPIRKQISRKTVARRLRGGGLYASRPVVCVPLTRQHRTARLQWCREHHNWTEQDWVCVLFSDESRFSLSSDCRRQLIWRESGTAYRPENIQEMDRYPTCSIMMWAGIVINGHTRLHVVANGTMTGQRYIDEVLLPHVRLFRGAVGDKFVFMDDNATCHRTLAVQNCLDSEGIQHLVWRARSPDLNPIENVWYALVRQVAGRNYPPTNKNTLIRALTEEWDKLPQQLLDNVVQKDDEKLNFALNATNKDELMEEEHVSVGLNIVKFVKAQNPNVGVDVWRSASQCHWDNHESAPGVIRNCSVDHDSRYRSSVSRLQTVLLQAFPWPPSDQHTAHTGTKAEPAFLRKHNRFLIRPPMSSDLTTLWRRKRKWL
ncbi:transposable element Tcb2 transposase [Trichonephila clavipes]|nr:transposable element Tcb2 transposase [Trichonephila clavipes]